jgi:hypothetical protein
LARFDGNLKAAGEAKLDVDELLSVLSGTSGAGQKERQEAITCFLSASEGWRDAKSRLKGTFASAVRPSWLTDSKE